VYVDGADAERRVLIENCSVVASDLTQRQHPLIVAGYENNMFTVAVDRKEIVCINYLQVPKI